VGEEKCARIRSQDVDETAQATAPGTERGGVSGCLTTYHDLRTTQKTLRPAGKRIPNLASITLVCSSGEE
jgi:hypothetical protein